MILVGSVAKLAGIRWNGLIYGGSWTMSDIKGRHFEGEFVHWAVR
jgi:hypothetical protein